MNNDGIFPKNYSISHISHFVYLSLFLNSILNFNYI